MQQKLELLIQDLKHNTRELFLIPTIVRAVELWDPHLKGHSQRVTSYCLQLAQHFDLTEEEMSALRLATQLHDAGKIGISERILRKPGPLEPAEWAEIKMHPLRAVELFSAFPSLRKALPIIRAHHERWDGRGYPDGMCGEEIPLEARILAVGDSYDAMTSDRPYRPAISPEQAVKELQRGSGSRYEPRVVATFVETLSEERLLPNKELAEISLL